MSRVILLLIMAVWLVGAEELQRNRPAPHGSITIHFAGYLVIVAAVAVWSRFLARRATAGNFRRLFRRLNQGLLIFRWMIPVWMALDVIRGGAWTQLVLARFGSRLELPAMIVGIAPAMLTWMALWWAEFPAERALREQNVLDELMHGMPVHEPPGLARILVTSLRQQLLPIVIPVLLITMFRDLISLSRFTAGWNDLMMIPGAVVVYLLSPFLLIWLFNARPLQASPLRQRLEAICQRCGLRYRNIMLWQTDFSMANAAVIGLLPGWRYVLLSDRLLETMTEVDWGWPTAQPTEAPRVGVEQSFVGQKGSALFAAALNRVAFVNNIPLRARGLFHPSIARRLLYLEEMSQDPVKTSRFDQVMRRLYAFMIVVLLSCALV